MIAKSDNYCFSQYVGTLIVNSRVLNIDIQLQNNSHANLKSDRNSTHESASNNEYNNSFEKDTDVQEYIIDVEDTSKRKEPVSLLSIGITF